MGKREKESEKVRQSEIQDDTDRRKDWLRLCWQLLRMRGWDAATVILKMKEETRDLPRQVEEWMK